MQSKTPKMDAYSVIPPQPRTVLNLSDFYSKHIHLGSSQQIPYRLHIEEISFDQYPQRPRTIVVSRAIFRPRHWARTHKMAVIYMCTALYCACKHTRAVHGTFSLCLNYLNEVYRKGCHCHRYRNASVRKGQLQAVGAWQSVPKHLLFLPPHDAGNFCSLTLFIP